MLKSHLERMVQSMQWADQRVIRAMADCPAAQTEALPLLAHLLAAERVWLARLERRDPPRDIWPSLSLAECESLAAENASGYSAYLAGLGEDGLAEIVEYQNMKGEPFATAVVDILTQVVTHGAYHRGQIAKVFGRAGTPAIGTDYITFVRSLAE